MAWLNKKKRRNPETGKTESYIAIAWRDTNGKIRERALGFIGPREATKRLRVFEGLLHSGRLAELDGVDDDGAPPASQSASPTRTTRREVSAPRRSRSAKRPMRSEPVLRSPEPRRTRKLGEYLDNAYLPRTRRQYEPKTVRGFHERARTLTRHLGTMRLDQLTFAVLDDYVLARTETVRTRTVQLELAFLRKALEHAVLRGELEALPQFPRVKLTDAKPHRFLTDDEAEVLLAALDPNRPQAHVVTRGRPPLQRDRHAWLAVLMALNTGMRSGELLSRKWSDIDWDDGPFGSIFVGDQPDIGFKPKTRRPRVVPLTPELRAALCNARAWSESEWVFPRRGDASRPRTTFTKALTGGCRRAGIPRIHPHGLRHSWASRLAKSGVDRRSLMELGGWKSSQLLDEVYSHVTGDHKADLMSRLGIEARRPDPEAEEEPDGDEV